MPPEFESIKNFLKGLDARTYATPLGAIAGLAAVRSLAPKSKRTWKTYGLGAGIGAGAGFAAGTAAEALRGDTPAAKPDVPPAAGSLTGGSTAPEEQSIKKKYDPVVRTRYGEATPQEQQNMGVIQKFMKTRSKGTPDPVRSKSALGQYYTLLTKTSGKGYEALLEAPAQFERATAVDAAGGIPQTSFSRGYPLAQTAIWDSTKFNPFGEHGLKDVVLHRNLLRDRARNTARENPKNYQVMAGNMKADLDRAAGDLMAYQERLNFLEQQKSNDLLPQDVRLRLSALAMQLRALMDQKNDSVNQKYIDLALWRVPGYGNRAIDFGPWGIMLQAALKTMKSMKIEPYQAP